MRVEILGSEFECRKLEMIIRKIADSSGIKRDVYIISDIDEILEYGISSTPAIIVDGRIRFSGNAPSENELRKILK